MENIRRSYDVFVMYVSGICVNRADRRLSFGFGHTLSLFLCLSLYRRLATLRRRHAPVTIDEIDIVEHVLEVVGVHLQ